MAGAIPAQASAARDRRGSSIAARRGRSVEFDLSDCGKPAENQSGQNRILCDGRERPACHILSRQSPITQAKQLVPNRPCWALEAAQASPSGAQVLLYRREDGSRVAIDLRGFDNVAHAPQRGPCFQLKIAGRLLLDVTNTDFRTAPSRTPASLRSLGPVLADRELRKVGTSVTAITALTAVVTGVTVLSSATGAECLHCNRPAPLRSRWEQK